MSIRRILVTGGAGFIGSHLCDRLIEDDVELLVIDNYYTGSLTNVSHLTGNKKFKIIKHDVSNPFDTEVDEIFNLACPASPVHYQKDPVRTTKTSVQGAINMLELANRVGARILQASTSEVYGDPEVHPQTESYWGRVNPTGPRACYDEGKRCAETLFFDFYRQYLLEIKVARIFNTYGPKMNINDGRVISNIIVQALRGINITIYGDGKQSRSFCYISDMVDGLIGLMKTKREIIGPVNLGNTNETTILELANMVIELTRSKSRISFVPLPEDDPTQRCPDTRLANKILDWQPKVSLEDGLIKTINYYRSVL